MNRTQDDTSQALLTAARELLTSAGPEALTVRRIATEAGMSTMNVYSRFGGKDGVIDELYAEGHRRLIDVIKAEPITDDLPASLLGIARRYRRFALENPAYYGIMFRHTVLGFAPSPAALEQAFANLFAFVERVELGQQRGDVSTSADWSSTDIAAWLWATCHGMISLELDGVGNEFISWDSIFDNGMMAAIRGLHPAVHPAPQT